MIKHNLILGVKLMKRATRNLKTCFTQVSGATVTLFPHYPDLADVFTTCQLWVGRKPPHWSHL